MLRIEAINVYYGAIHALCDVSIEVAAGEVVAIIGSNGAGKSTLLRTISGILRPRTGSIWFDSGNPAPGSLGGELGRRRSESDIEISTRPAHHIVQMGISHSPEGRRIFTNMSVYENLLLGAYTRKDEISSDMDEVMKRFPRLKERIKQSAGTLSGGEQQMLAIGRALMSRPKLLLLDEPSLGLAPNLVTEIFSIIRELNSDGTTILLVEQNAHLALAISNRAYVLETGNIVLADTGQRLLNNPKVKEAYLGG